MLNTGTIAPNLPVSLQQDLSYAVTDPGESSITEHVMNFNTTLA